MTLRVALVIDGNAAGAKQAAQETARALGGIGDAARQASAIIDLMRGKIANGLFDKGQIAQGINAQLGIGAGLAGRGEDIAAYGRALDAVRAKFNPLFAAGQEYKATLGEINSAYRVGAISETERAAAIQRTKDAFVQQVAVLRGGVAASAQAAAATGALTQAHGGLSTQAMALSHSLRSAAEQMVLGIPPTQILAGQINHLSYAASGPGGLKGAFKEVVGLLGAFLSPAALVTAGAIAIGGALVYAGAQADNADRAIERALLGIGRASGVTVGQIKAIGAASASAGDLSVAEATRIASGYAALGTIGGENIGKLTEVTKGFGVLIGQSADEAQAALGKIFADPGKGAEQLARQFGILDAATLHYVQSLAASGSQQQAISVLLAKLTPEAQRAAQTVGLLGRAWDTVAKGVSSAIDWVGNKLIDGGLTRLTADQLNALKQRYADLLKQIEAFQAQSPKDLFASGVQAEADGYRKKIEDIDAALKKLGDDAAEARRKQDNLFSLRVGAALDEQSPEFAQARRLGDTLALLETQMAKVNASGGAQSPLLAGLGRTYEQLAAEIDKARGAVQGFSSSTDRELTGLRLQIGAIGKRSPSALGEIAFQQSLLNSGNMGADAVAKAQLEKTIAIKTAEQQIVDAKNQQLLAAQQGVVSAELELAIIGRSATEQEGLRAKLQAKQQLEQDALRVYGNRDAYDKAHLAALEKEIDRQTALKQLLAEQNALREASFQRAIIGMSSDEQQIAQQLRSLYGENWQAFWDGNVAGAMRLNQSLSFFHDTGLGALQDFNSALRQGATRGEAFGQALDNALGKIESKLIEMASNQLWRNAFGGGGGFDLFGMFGFGGGGGGGGGGGTFGGTAGILPPLYDSGGYTGDMPTNAVAGVVHGREYVFDADTTRRIGPANLEAFRRSVRGYAGGGYVGPPVLPADMRAARGGGGGGGGPLVSINVHEAPGVVSREERRPRPDGGEDIDIRQQLRGEFVATAAGGAFDRINRDRYGLPRRLVNRP